MKLNGWKKGRKEAESEIAIKLWSVVQKKALRYQKQVIYLITSYSTNNINILQLIDGNLERGLQYSMV